jgi:hypothetical protein
VFRESVEIVSYEEQEFEELIEIVSPVVQKELLEMYDEAYWAQVKKQDLIASILTWTAITCGAMISYITIVYSIW